MLEINDYSSRRGVLVPFFPKIHAMLKENAEKDKFSNLEPPEHLITWQQKMRRDILDINRRLLVAVDGDVLAGVFFYRHERGKVFLEDVHVAWLFRNNPHIIEGFLKKIESDPDAKDATFFASERIKIEADKEILASKGFKTEHEDGWEKLGTLSQAMAALKIRYTRGA